MSATIIAAQRRRTCLLASSFLAPVISLQISAASAQQSASSSQLPPIEVTSPGDENRTRAKPVTDEGTGTRRVVRPAPTNTTSAAPSDGSGASPSSGGTRNGGAAVPPFNGIVGAAAAAITPDDIAHSPSPNLPANIAPNPGVQP